MPGGLATSRDPRSSSRLLKLADWVVTPEPWPDAPTTRTRALQSRPTRKMSVAASSLVLCSLQYKLSTYDRDDCVVS